MPGWGEPFGWMMRNLIIGATRNWARTVVLWNLALDDKHGPHLGGCGDCRGVVTVHSQTGALTRNLEYYALAHVSRFVRRGARRIASTSVTGGVENVAFRNPDGSVVVVAYNAQSAAQNVSIRWRGRQASMTMPARSAATFAWTPSR
jgi:glucosylceramidase